jgi:hypothetical protein
MSKMKYAIIIAICLMMGLCNSVAVVAQQIKGAEQSLKKADDAKHAEKRTPVVQIAIVLDNSGSMGGLIDQARTELWKVVNEFVGARVDGVRPELYVAVYKYGDPPATKLVDLTDDLDKVSEALFAIPVSGGSEYCGAAIDAATRELKWSESNDDLKIIFIAGNEPFSQGNVPYQDACKAAIAKGIIVNTIHCGSGIPADWRDGALLADGKAMNIDHTTAVVHIESPFDKKIAELGVEINKTYIAFGAAGEAGLARQSAQDGNAMTAGAAGIGGGGRAVSKASGYYKNASWDLCDWVKEKGNDITKIKEEDLPENMRKMTMDERKAHVAAKQKEREKISKEIMELNKKREAFVGNKRKEMAEESGKKTLDSVMIEAIQAQAKEKKYSFEDRE